MVISTVCFTLIRLCVKENRSQQIVDDRMENLDTQGTSQITAAMPENLSTFEDLTSGIHNIRTQSSRQWHSLHSDNKEKYTTTNKKIVTGN